MSTSTPTPKRPEPTSKPSSSSSPIPAAAPLSRLPADEESELLSESHALKATATASFTSSDLSSAIDFYARALTPLPSYCHYEIAVLHANIAACHLRLRAWKDAADAASQALDELHHVDPVPQEQQQQQSQTDKPATSPAQDDNSNSNNSNTNTPRISEISDALEARIAILTALNHSLSDLHKLRTKALLRRAKARAELGTWAELQGAIDDYTALSQQHAELSSADRRTVQGALRTLPARLDAAKSREMADMMGKLKGLGNGLLRPFGLSTDNFQFVKDERTGGYNMNFNR
ncbi:hypothetical protein EJ05DRAFT_192850 [Pseudovirgaria hyperparasitica]|uniref:Tetratricopeptide repeat protein 1 n=1 Tax=Pseudovirgaria hyperparasitica TaxID=470096 RepID=A0A6A6WGL6_9PEZI|nr:uncharacterized protein EJ05DRAFT_192850 [Pseudovirgaria hyperparasitica]KAF2762002.1 hypothetical protein EJ05DRAFT_192850 [Pseudovirgaria hyperparasitica]